MVSRPDDATRALADARCDILELRIDRWEGGRDELRNCLQGLPAGRWILTCRHPDEGGAYRGNDADRLALLATAAQIPGGTVDVEWAHLPELLDYLNQHNIRRQAKLLASAHNFSGPFDQPNQLHRSMAEHPDVDIIKIVWQAHRPQCNFDALRLWQQAGKPTAAFAMGEMGLPSRLLAKKYGAFATYASMQTDTPTAPGQPSVSTVLTNYRWNHIGPATKVYGVIGDPVRHSLSPILFNHLFQQRNIDAFYIPWLIPNTENALHDFLDGVDAFDANGDYISGFSVTIPHKEAAFALAAPASEPTKRAHAANTLMRTPDGWHCINTDIAGLIGALERSRSIQFPCRAAILGAGGAARAAVVGLMDRNCDVTIYNRSPQRARQLASEFHCAAKPWDHLQNADYNLLVNTTSVGMWPHVDESPMPSTAHRPGTTVMDMIYRPLNTKLLSDARSAGCNIVSGLDMFVTQAIEQYKYFQFPNASQIDVEELRQFVELTLQKSQSE